MRRTRWAAATIAWPPSRPWRRRPHRPSGCPAKSLVADLSLVVASLPGKVEGLALIGRRTLAVANDNDFGAGHVTLDGRVSRTGVPTRIVTIELPRPL
ncbi:hypothetical protein AB0L44_40160 [Nonomuraea wenchangensis]|uniref:hypothetical protein n=1 Tax=Nonomuraea wenchangensis TaxID=568860 RepID=UPI00341EAB9A